MKKMALWFGLLFVVMIAFIMTGCGEVQSDYYEVHVIVVDNQPFYFINPSEGKDLISAKYLGSGDTQFIYLYEPKDGVDFSYEHFFSTIQSRYIEEDTRNGKLYLLANQEIDQFITQYFIDKEAFEASSLG